MGASCLRLSGRPLGVALLALGLVTPASPAAAQEGAVFVGDQGTSQGPKLPTLAAPTSAGDPRYAPSAVLKAGGPATMGRGMATPAYYNANAASSAPSEPQRMVQPMAQTKKREHQTLWSRFMSGDKSKEQQPAPKLAQRPSPAPKKTTSPRSTSGQKSLLGSKGPATRSTGQQQSGLLGYLRSRAGNSESKKPQQQLRSPAPRTKSAPVAKAKPQAIKKQSRPSDGVTVSEPTVRVAAAPAKPKASAPLPQRSSTLNKQAGESGVVFVGDRPASEPEPAGFLLSDNDAKLPRPQPMKEPLLKAPPLTATSSGLHRAELHAIDPAPAPVPASQALKTRPVLPSPKPQEGLVEEEYDVADFAPAPRKPVDQEPALVAVPAPKAEANPVPPKPQNTTPTPRAVALLVEANRQAQLAATEEEFTRVVRRCRHVLAIDNSKDAVLYSRNLAGWALNKRGELRADEGRVSEAMNDFDDALRMDPEHWRSVHNRGVLLAQSGHFAEAFDAFNQTIVMNPEFAKAFSNRGSLYVQAGDFEAAMHDYTRAIAVDPDLAIAHKGQGRVCHMLGHMDEAMQHLDAAVLLAPNDASIATARADLMVDLGRYAAAAGAYGRAVQLDPDAPDAYRNLAWLQATCPDRRFLSADSALANVNKSIALLGEEDDISLDTLGAAYAAAGDFAAAIDSVKRAMELAPASDQPMYLERLSRYEAGRPFIIAPVAPVSPVRQATLERTVR